MTDFKLDGARPARTSTSRQLLASSQHQSVVWHPYPEVPLPETEFAKAYLVTAVSSKGDQEPFVREAYGSKNFLAYEEGFTVVA